MANVIRMGGTKAVGGLEVRVDGDKKTYHVPLLGQLTMGDLMTFRRISKMPDEERNDAYMDAFYELCIRYVPQQAVDSLTVEEFGQFVQAWQDASDEVEPGE